MTFLINLPKCLFVDTAIVSLGIKQVFHLENKLSLFGVQTSNNWFYLSPAKPHSPWVSKHKGISESR